MLAALYRSVVLDVAGKVIVRGLIRESAGLKVILIALVMQAAVALVFGLASVLGVVVVEVGLVVLLHVVNVARLTIFLKVFFVVLLVLVVVVDFVGVMVVVHVVVVPWVVLWSTERSDAFAWSSRGCIWVVSRLFLGAWGGARVCWRACSWKAP